jgi:MoaA/NifB/PqqE/SkfB family radical SAM enzyme
MVRSYLKKLVEILVNAGCKDYQVSLEGDDAITSYSIRENGVFDKVISGINNLKLTNARISLAVAISSKNYNRIQQIFDFAQIL